MLWNVVAVIAVSGSALHLLPQIWKAVRTKHTSDISWSMLLLHFVSNIAWLSYGVHVLDVPLVIVSVINVLADLILLALKCYRG